MQISISKVRKIFNFIFHLNFFLFILYITVENFGVRCLMFWKEVSYAQQGCIYLIKMTVNIVKYYYNLK